MLVATYSFLAGVDLRGADLDSQCDFTPPIVHSATEYAQGATTHDPARRLTTLESCFERFNKAECEVHFRFEQHELAQLYDSLGFPPSVRLGATGNWKGMLFHKSEVLLVMLKRLAYPNRLFDLQETFGLSAPQLSVVFEYATRFITLRFEPMLRSPCIWADYIPDWAEAVWQKTGRFDSVYAFIDGTVRQICRPGPRHIPGTHRRVDIQRLFYSGHKRKHGLKFQTMVAPCGIIMHLWGPFPGRGNDARMLRESGLMADLARLRALMAGAAGAAAHQVLYYVYGDPAYPVSPFMMRSIFGIGMTLADRQVNTDMSRVRICVEWQYGELLQIFAFLDFSQNLKLHLQPLHHYFVTGVLLLNCRVCMRGLRSKTPRFFRCCPPSLAEYLGLRGHPDV